MQGDKLGQFELRHELGRGSMAVVWLAWDSALEREVAIKEPLPDPRIGTTAGGQIAERFVREGKAAAGLSHPGIVTIYDADVYDGRPAIIMELIRGRTLASILNEGRLEPAAAISILDQLLDATGYAHARGVVHRDIKPDNVFVTDDGRVKLADFGIAHVGADSTLTQAGTVMGTPGYMAPEQVRGAKVDARSDLFACGVIGYEMLTGVNPFTSDHDTQSTAVMYRIVHEDPPPLGDWVTEGLAADPRPAIAAALSKDPAMRPADDGAFRAALRGGNIRIAGGTDPGITLASAPVQPTLTAPAPPAPGASSWIPWVAGVTLGVLALVALVVVLNFASAGRSTAGVAVSQPSPAQTPSAVPTQQPDTSAGGPSGGDTDSTAASEVDPATEVEDAVTDWAAALGDDDLDRHMSHYADYVDFFDSSSASNDEIRSIKANALAKYSSFATTLSDIEVSMESDSDATVTFRKTSTRFRSDGSQKQDSVRQRLRLQLQGDGWKIIDEKDL